MDLQEALNNSIWLEHKIGDTYSMIHIGGKIDKSNWEIAYYPLLGTYNNRTTKQGETIYGGWIDFEDPRALVEMTTKDGIIFQETPIRYLVKNVPESK